MFRRPHPSGHSSRSFKLNFVALTVIKTDSVDLET
jgi:hypothetical protein